MAQLMPFLMQQVLNRPLAVSSAQADLIAMVLSGKLNITALEDAAGILRDRSYMDRATAAARAAIDEKRDMQGSAQLLSGEPATGKTYEQAGSIAVIRIQGTLTRTWGVGPYSGKTGYDGIQIQLLEAIEDKTVKAIWLDINSGGGAVDGLFDTCAIVRALSAREGGKPIYAMAADHAYSAAFALATSADRVFVPRSGGVGSVGCIVLHADLTGALEEDGIKVTHIRSGRNKGRGGPFEPLNDETLAHIQSQVDEAADMFQDLVAENLGLAKKTVQETEGLDYMGRHAKAIGFVHDVMSEPHAWAELERLVS